MMSINFEIYKDQDDDRTAVSEQTLMNLLKSNSVFRDELLRKNHRGSFGKIEIRFYKHSLVMATETVWYLMFAVHLQAIKAIKQGVEFRNYLENATGEYITFDYIDAGTEGVRIRYYGVMRYEDGNGDEVFVSRTDYMKQEIIVPKNLYIFEMLNCISGFIQYRELLACKDPEDYYLQDFKKELDALK
jgi:hypothetical protein